MGLIVLFSVEKFNLPLLEDDLASLCNLLCSNANSPDALRNDLNYIFGTSQRYLCVCVCVRKDFIAISNDFI